MQRVLFLVDMNAFFISCEMTRRPELLGHPAAVAGDPKKRAGIILAANYEARAKGVKTAMVVHEALRLCPAMILVPPDHHFYEQKSEEVMALLSAYTPLIEQNSIDEAWLDMTGCDLLFGTPVAAAERILDEIRDQLGLWCSIGIAENKFLSKMASEMKKPLGITALWPQDIPTKLWPLPVKAMYGIGDKTADRLNSMGIRTIGELAGFNPHRLTKVFGKAGMEISNHACGIDESPVIPRIADDIKSIGRSTTLPEDITEIQAAKLVLMALSDDIGMTARRNHKRGRTVQIVLKYSDFQVITRQMTIKETCTTKEIYQAGCSLIEQNWNRNRGIRLIGISLTGFHADAVLDQISFFDELEHGQGIENKNAILDEAMDWLRSKHGVDIIKPGSLVGKGKSQTP